MFLNKMGKTETLTVEAFLFTFGKGAKDAARAGALVQVAEALAWAAIEEAGGTGIRVYTEGVELFSPVEPAVSKGLGAYRVGVRIKDETVSKVDVRHRRSVGAVFDAVLDAVERAKSFIGGLFG